MRLISPAAIGRPCVLVTWKRKQFNQILRECSNTGNFYFKCVNKYICTDVTNNSNRFQDSVTMMTYQIHSVVVMEAEYNCLGLW